MLFDLGDTLFEPLEPTIAETNLRQFCHSCHIDTPLPEFRAKLNQAKKSSAEKFSRQSFYRHRDFVIDSLERCTVLCGGDHPSHDVLQRYVDAQRDSVVSTLQPRADSFITLEQLRQREIKIGIVSNIDDDWLNPLIQKWQLHLKVDLCLSSESARSCKPDAAIFTEAYQSLQVQPSQTAFVGDTEITDIKGANALNLTSVLFHEGPKPADSNAKHHIKSISEVLQLVDEN